MRTFINNKSFEKERGVSKLSKTGLVGRERGGVKIVKNESSISMDVAEVKMFIVCVGSKECRKSAE